jgi:hypothetical protein
MLSLPKLLTSAMFLEYVETVFVCKVRRVSRKAIVSISCVSRERTNISSSASIAFCKLDWSFFAFIPISRDLRVSGVVALLRKLLIIPSFHLVTCYHPYAPRGRRYLIYVYVYIIPHNSTFVN